jgi:hypothetical protein
VHPRLGAAPCLDPAGLLPSAVAKFVFAVALRLMIVHVPGPLGTFLSEQKKIRFLDPRCVSRLPSYPSACKRDQGLLPTLSSSTRHHRYATCTRVSRGPRRKLWLNMCPSHSVPPSICHHLALTCGWPSDLNFLSLKAPLHGSAGVARKIPPGSYSNRGIGKAWVLLLDSCVKILTAWTHMLRQFMY